MKKESQSFQLVTPAKILSGIFHSTRARQDNQALVRCPTPSRNVTDCSCTITVRFQKLHLKAVKQHLYYSLRISGQKQTLFFF